MAANANSSHRRIASDLVNSPGFLGAAARFWQVRTAIVFPNTHINPRHVALVCVRLCGTCHSYSWLYLGESFKNLVVSQLINGKAQIQFLAEPFHRMFFLDNLSISYPHAEVERVSVSTYSLTPNLHFCLPTTH